MIGLSYIKRLLLLEKIDSISKVITSSTLHGSTSMKTQGPPQDPGS